MSLALVHLTSMWDPSMHAVAKLAYGVCIFVDILT